MKLFRISSKMRTKVIIGVCVCACVGAAMVATLGRGAGARALLASAAASQYGWLLSLAANVAGYATVLLPLFLLRYYLQRVHYFDTPMTSSWLSRALFACFVEPGERLPVSGVGVGLVAEAGAGVKVDGGDGARGAGEGEGARRGAKLAVCFSGLLGSYLVWGLQQEKIMTQTYTMYGEEVKFRDSQFLVFINRLMAFIFASLYVLRSRRPIAGAPLHKYSYCALTNVLSAWCQYEALKYVSYPTQVLSKSCKVIPVMMMGRLVSGTRFDLYEYVTAALISVGMLLFMLGANDHISTGTVTTISGVALLSLYLACDSFTSSWQGRLFQQYRASPLHAMLGVNLCSCALTAVALAQQPSTLASLAMLQNPIFVTDCILLCISSTVGQFFIFDTISNFGAVVFAIIMTLRQALSILLSCAVYGHSLSAGGVAGATLVLTAVAARLYCRYYRISGAKL